MYMASTWNFECLYAAGHELCAVCMFLKTEFSYLKFAEIAPKFILVLVTLGFILPEEDIRPAYGWLMLQCYWRGHNPNSAHWKKNWHNLRCFHGRSASSWGGAYKMCTILIETVSHQHRMHSPKSRHSFGDVPLHVTDSVRSSSFASRQWQVSTGTFTCSAQCTLKVNACLSMLQAYTSSVPVIVCQNSWTILMIRFAVRPSCPRRPCTVLR